MFFFCTGLCVAFCSYFLRYSISTTTNNDRTQGKAKVRSIILDSIQDFSGRQSQKLDRFSFLQLHTFSSLFSSFSLRPHLHPSNLSYPPSPPPFRKMSTLSPASAGKAPSRVSLTLGNLPPKQSGFGVPMVSLYLSHCKRWTGSGKVEKVVIIKSGG